MKFINPYFQFSTNIKKGTVDYFEKYFLNVLCELQFQSIRWWQKIFMRKKVTFSLSNATKAKFLSFRQLFQIWTKAKITWSSRANHMVSWAWCGKKRHDFFLPRRFKRSRIFYWRNDLGLANLPDIHVERVCSTRRLKKVSAENMRFCQNILTWLWASFFKISTFFTFPDI